MGSFTSALVPTREELVPEKLKPSSAGWIPTHVKACNAPVIKVQRCWHRFVQLGSDKNGTLTLKAKIYSTTDRFLKQVLALLPKNERNEITFQVFVNACMWFESADPEMKAKLFFYLLNKGESMNSEVLTRVMSHLYEGVPQAELQDLATLTVKEIGEKNQEYFSEDDFVKWVLSKSIEELQTLFAFSLLPT